MVLPHKLKKTGYKAPNAYGARPLFTGETTNRHFQKGILTAGTGKGAQCLFGKKLEPYSPNAPRNRPKETLLNVVGNRHKLHPCIKTETYRGSSQVRLADGDPESTRPWKTTNQVFNACAQVQDTVGLANSGISSTIAHIMHKQQGIYG
jgi:hypothetical protein